MKTSNDIAIVGGGLVGAAIGWGIAPSRPRIAILDEGDLALRASRGNFALVWVQGKGAGMPQYGMWTLRAAESREAFAESLQRQTGIDVHYRQPGGFHIALSRGELEKRLADLAQIQAQPGMPRIHLETLNPAVLRTLLPEIGPAVAGATYSKHDGHQRFACCALHAFRLHGGTYHTDHRVSRSHTPTANSESRRTAGSRGIDRARGRPRQCKARPHGGNGDARAPCAASFSPPRKPAVPRLSVSTVHQTDEGTVLIGDSKEEIGFDRATTDACRDDRCAGCFPRLARLNVVRSWAALRVMPRDGSALYEASSDCPGAYALATHSGVTLAPNHALVLARHIARAEGTAEPFRAFSARRFDVPKAA